MTVTFLSDEAGTNTVMPSDAHYTVMLMSLCCNYVDSIPIVYTGHINKSMGSDLV